MGMTCRLVEAGEQGPAWAWPDAATLRALRGEVCYFQIKTGFFEPLRATVPPPIEDCKTALAFCEHAKLGTNEDCLSCAQKSGQNVCTNNEKHAFCDATIV